MSILTFMTLIAIVITSSHSQQIPLTKDRWEECQQNKIFCLGMKRGETDLKAPSQVGSCFPNKECDYWMIVEKTPTNVQYTLYLSGLDKLTSDKVNLNFKVFFSKTELDPASIKKKLPAEEIVLEAEVSAGKGDPRCWIEAQDTTFIEICQSNVEKPIERGSLLNPSATNRYAVFAWKSDNPIKYENSGRNIDYSIDLAKDSLYMYFIGRSNSVNGEYDQRARSLPAVFLGPVKVYTTTTLGTTTEPTTTPKTGSGSIVPSVNPGDPSTTVASTEKPKNDSNTLVIVIVIIVVFLLIGGGAAGYWYYMKNKKKRPDGPRRPGFAADKDASEFNGDMRSAFNNGTSEVMSVSPRDKELISNIH